MIEKVYFGAGKIADRLGLSVYMTRRLLKEKIVIAHKSRGKGIWYCNETEIIKTIQERLPGRL